MAGPEHADLPPAPTTVPGKEPRTRTMAMKGGEKGTTNLGVACALGKADWVQRLLAAHAAIDQAESDGT